MSNTICPVSKDDYIMKLKGKLPPIQERLDLDTPRLEFLFDEIHKLIYPLQVFGSLRKLWIRVEHEPFFSHDMDDRLVFLEMQISALNLQQKEVSFNQKAEELLELQKRVANSLRAAEDLENLEVEQLKLVLRNLENDEREYLEYDIGNILEEFEEEKLFEKMVELVERMENMMAVVTQKLRSIALANSSLN